MRHKYRYRFPVKFAWFKWGFTLSLQQPIVRIDSESISIFLNFTNDDW
jgi:hypothetical protein